jgi:hypothetical protein
MDLSEETLNFNKKKKINIIKKYKIQTKLIGSLTYQLKMIN